MKGTLEMPFFKNLLAEAPPVSSYPSDIVLVLSETDMTALEGLLAKVSYEHAAPIVRAFRDASDVQRRGGMLDVVEQVLELHRSALAYRERASIEEEFH
jgi:hypothetical protein